MLTPGYCAGVLAGVSARLLGNVMGSRPPGSTSPNKVAAIALPSSSPGYQASSTPATWSSHGMSTGAPVLSTTTVRGLAAATADTSASWNPGSARVARSIPSASMSPTNTTATSEALAAATACAIAGSSAPAGAVQPSSTVPWLA